MKSLAANYNQSWFDDDGDEKNVWLTNSVRAISVPDWLGFDDCTNNVCGEDGYHDDHDENHGDDNLMVMMMMTMIMMMIKNWR